MCTDQAMARGPGKHQDLKHGQKLLRPKKAGNSEGQRKLDSDWNPNVIHDKTDA
jgi:hypothetical protein